MPYPWNKCNIVYQLYLSAKYLVITQGKDDMKVDNIYWLHEALWIVWMLFYLTLPVSCDVDLTTIHTHFTDEKSETEKCYMTCPSYFRRH